MLEDWQQLKTITTHRPEGEEEEGFPRIRPGQGLGTQRIIITPDNSIYFGKTGKLQELKCKQLYSFSHQSQLVRSCPEI